MNIVMNHRKKLQKKKFNINKVVMPLVFLAPGIIFTIGLKYVPILKAMYTSLFQYDYINPPGKFVGFQNYTNMFKEGFYWSAWRNTIVFLVLTLLITFLIPIIQALFLSEIIKGRKLFTTIYIMIAVIPLSVNVVIWKILWNPDYGYINVILGWFNAAPKTWLSDPAWTKFCIIFPGILGGGVGVLIYLAAILGVSGEIIESAKLDGCTGIKTWIHIILPNIKFIIFIQLLITVIGAMQMLDAPFQYTNGGPGGASTTMGIFIYKSYKEDLTYGKSSAASLVLLIFIAIITIIQMKMDNSEAE